MRRPEATRRLLLGRGLWGGLLGALAALPGVRSARAQQHSVAAHPVSSMQDGMAVAHATHGGMITVGEVDHARNGFDPHAILTDWDSGTLTTDAATADACASGRSSPTTRRSRSRPGVFFPAWTYNGRVPGPDAARQRGRPAAHPLHERRLAPAHACTSTASTRPRMDGVPGSAGRDPARRASSSTSSTPSPSAATSTTATPLPLKRHIHKGLYGAFIVNPDPAQPSATRPKPRARRLSARRERRWQEFVMVMNAFDTNFDDENEVYAVNTRRLRTTSKHPIAIDRTRPVRIYLVNVTEFDLINSFHLHANFFDYYDHGTTLEPTLRTVDTVMQCQAQRGILEFSFEDHEPGLYMFHAHQSEFAELGWMSLFDVRAGATRMSRPLAWALLPLLLIVLIGAAFLVSDPLRPFSAGRAAAGGAHGRAHGARRRRHRALGARRRHGADPRSRRCRSTAPIGPSRRIRRGRCRGSRRRGCAFPIPGCQGETHHVVMLSRAGVPFEHTIDVAVATPTRGSLTALGLVGLFVGVRADRARACCSTRA